MTDIAQPHDRFLKALLSDPERAGALLRERLPAEVVESLADEPPELLEGTFVDDEMRSHLTDRLFRVRTVSGRAALLYVLIEHKSQPEKRIAWQLLRYMVEALKQWERENPAWERLPAILPLVFYHGAAAWRIPDAFLALVDAETGWRPWLLDFRFPVVDLGRIDDAELSRQPRLGAWLLVAKYALRDAGQLGILERLARALRDAPEDFPFLLRYIVETFARYDEGTLREIIRRVRPEEEEEMMSQFAQDVIARSKPEWLRQGRQEGRQEGEAALLLRLLQQRFGALPDWVVERVNAAAPEALEAWFDRALEAPSLEALFG